MLHGAQPDRRRDFALIALLLALLLDFALIALLLALLLLPLSNFLPALVLQVPPPPLLSPFGLLATRRYPWHVGKRLSSSTIDSHAHLCLFACLLSDN